MRIGTFDQAIESALAQAMAEDARILLIGEDLQLIRRNLYVRFGPRRVRDAPISESAFVGAAVSAAMAGLRPIVELQQIDFVGVAMDALLNHAAKLDAFSGGKWTAPFVLRAPCGAGIGDGGQHQQSLWGWLAHIPGLTVVVPSTPADAGRLLIRALQHDGPVIFLEHKLLATSWLDLLGLTKAEYDDYDVPPAGARGYVPERWTPLPLGEAIRRRTGNDLTIATLGVSVHHSLDVAETLSEEDVDVEVIDLRSLTPLDVETLRLSVTKTGRLLVIDEDYERFGLSGEIAASLLEYGMKFDYARVCTRSTIPYARHLEHMSLPNRDRILEAARKLTQRKSGKDRHS
jgi:pyruvate dehydrogenase E1 component beta subunit